MQQWPPEVVRIIQQFEQRIKELEEENKQLKKRITQLENKLRIHESPHTPPSLQRFKGKVSGTNPPGKRGAPPGHHGATRNVPEPDEIIPVTMDTCPRCGSYLGQAVGIESRTIEELPPPQKIQVTQYDLHKYVCPGCGCEITARHQDCQMVGNLGIRLMTQISMAKFHQRGVLRRIQEGLQGQNGFLISPKGIHDVLLRVGDACIPEYDLLKQRIWQALWKHADETVMPVIGKHWWLWIFRSNTDDVLVVIRPSRGKKVLEEIFGSNPQGALVNDGYPGYRWLPVVQRCWAHLLREIDDLREPSEHEQLLSEEIHKRFDLLKEFIGKDPPMEERVRQKEIWDGELQTVVNKHLQYLDTCVKAQYIKNGLGCWYTCLLYPGMQPTNNLAEQAIREHVIMRKIIGTFRSERGSENYQYIASLLATWKLQGKNMSEELENLLRRELCLSMS
ncbi:MAG: IS66 family transposase [Euryarchaeota archaeon]|nr:IS66 family transposase [Euryarchaeota archaeon]